MVISPRIRGDHARICAHWDPELGRDEFHSVPDFFDPSRETDSRDAVERVPTQFRGSLLGFRTMRTAHEPADGRTALLRRPIDRRPAAQQRSPTVRFMESLQSQRACIGTMNPKMRKPLKMKDSIFVFMESAHNLRIALRDQEPVAQTCSLPYRRFVTCRAPDALPIRNRRYSRLKICATRNQFMGRRTHLILRPHGFAGAGAGAGCVFDSDSSTTDPPCHDLIRLKRLMSWNEM